MDRQEFSYELPPELIAQHPLTERSASRMLVLEASRAERAPRDDGGRALPAVGPPARSESRDLGSREPATRDLVIRDLPQLLNAGDLLLFNDTKVIAARLLGTKPSGGRVEVFLERPTGEREALAQLRASKPIREGLEVTTPGGIVRILERAGDLWRIEVPDPVVEFFERWGEVPLPPYIHRAVEGDDRQRYQTIFAREPGAVAAPTASLHFDQPLMDAFAARNIRHAFVTLHVGSGTFQPLRTRNVDLHEMHAERASVSAATCAAIERARVEGRRVIAVGTTVVRAIESAAGAAGAAGRAGSPDGVGAAGAAGAASAAGGAAGAGTAAGTANPGRAGLLSCGLPSAGWSGETRLFIRPGFHFRITDALLTNFHLPESTLLMLVCAFGGKEAVLAAYRHAVEARYRFFSYGDSMFLTRANPGS